MNDNDRAETVRRIANGFGVPVELVLMTDGEFHWWLHNTEDGRALLAADEEANS